MRFVDLRRGLMAGVAAVVLGLGAPAPANAAMDLTAFRQAVAEAAAKDDAIAAFYRQRGYAPFWTSAEAADRRAALLSVLAQAPDHGLPASRYDPEALIAAFRGARSLRDIGRAEVAAMDMFLAYAHDVSSGVIEPGRVLSDIKREIARPDPATLLARIAATDDPAAFLRSLAPRSPEYARLLREKMRLERLIAEGGWGPEVPRGTLRPGQSGAAVIALRNRMIAMGYLSRSAAATYDAALQTAVQAFQLDHGIAPDGVAGAGTIDEINLPAEARLRSVLVAMERERWLGNDRGDRHVLVNITDFHARIIEEGEVVFQTRSVVGKNQSDQRTPEFSDVMEHMVVNPTWNVPRSIAVNEYLPRMQANPNAHGYLQLVDGSGRVVSRGAIDFARYTARNFPFDLKQPPSRGNALGLVKFMFPNPYNIYLHDTPSKSLFDREVRAFSHGCIRLGDPFDFAYALLAAQTDDPKGFFAAKLATGRETRVDLEQPLPVHIIYRTAVTDPRGRMQYRRDVYGRDAAIFEALEAAGVALAPVRG
ncbi:L,D-transpeptidase family protein [Rhodovulum euryhalinum]|uniref:Murein L,D-transpeptidase YcbB/YkuD n=1 Tax=Rhodovulum euryhalinum TaxID=35805 RepID=A0A4R2K8W2_9RHOB|nr:L,D-transpeptidase family protein [Rhodovulum euryhalinum]TCO69811.1 murein L,D-transpeptidase YcbB/YkuD [Rhodovulum euryhalinum]